MAREYSAWSLLRHAVAGHAAWPRAWRDAALQRHYDAIVVGGGGHGLATAYYLAKNHGMRRVAVLEKGWIGGGNTGRNTTVVRSNYYYPESARLYDLALRLYEGLADELNFNIMLSQRGMMMLAQSRHDLDMMTRAANAMLVNGIDAELLDAAEVRRRIPALAADRDMRFPLWGALNQPRGGIARHDAVAWGYARAADRLGVDIVQGCEVLDLLREGDRVVGVRTSRGDVAAPVTGLAVAGHSSVLAAKAGLELPVVSYALQAFVSEPVKPVLDTVLLSSATGTYLSQSDKGELVIGGGLDLYPSYAQRGNLPTVETIVAGLLDVFPRFARLRLMRQWAGIVDVVPDSSPILGPSPVPGLFLNCGWGTGGFKAIPAGGWLLAHSMATGAHHDISRPFDLARFTTGDLVDEGAAAGISH